MLFFWGTVWGPLLEVFRFTLLTALPKFLRPTSYLDRSVLGFKGSYKMIIVKVFSFL
jgi:hypothetical protein